jgi:hypothetical protein
MWVFIEAIEEDGSDYNDGTFSIIQIVNISKSLFDYINSNYEKQERVIIQN